MNNHDFKLGDLVALKSGSPEMTITNSKKYNTNVTDFTCLFFNYQTNSFQEVIAPGQCLKLVE